MKFAVITTVFLSVPSTTLALDEALLAADFTSICIEQLPSIENAVSAAQKRGYIILTEGIAPEVDDILDKMPEWTHLVRKGENDGFVPLRLTIKDTDPNNPVAMGASIVALCEFGVFKGDAEMFAEALSDRLRLTQPVLDIVNSGNRERMWETYVDYSRSTIFLKELNSDSNGAFTASVVVPEHQR